VRLWTSFLLLIISIVLTAVNGLNDSSVVIVTIVAIVITVHLQSQYGGSRCDILFVDMGWELWRLSPGRHLRLTNGVGGGSRCGWALLLRWQEGLKAWPGSHLRRSPDSCGDRCTRPWWVGIFTMGSGFGPEVKVFTTVTYEVIHFPLGTCDGCGPFWEKKKEGGEVTKNSFSHVMTLLLPPLMAISKAK
jgi:hypothetical protein